MHRVISWLSLWTISLFLTPRVGSAEETSIPNMPEAQIEFFEKRIRPVLANNCFKCHGPKQQKGGLRLDSREAILKGGDTGPAIAPGEPDNSELVLAIRYDADGYQMPPPGKLADDKIADLTAWVKMGAPWPDSPEVTTDDAAANAFSLSERAKHWSFQPIQAVTPPKLSVGTDHNSVRNPIDLFIQIRLAEEGLKPSGEAAKRTLIRRLNLDLLGLPPTPEETAAFVADDSPDAYERLVDRYLASPRYGERWGRHWLDLVRFAETAGHEFDYSIHYSRPYRDYIIRAFNDDLPYDRLVREHIAGDLLPNPRRHPTEGFNQSIVGTAFWWFAQGKHSPVDIRAEECDTIDNQLDVFGKTFLGLTIACARCHDHKFDPITANDYYAMAGFLQSSRRQHAFIDSPKDFEPTLTALSDWNRANRAALLGAYRIDADSISQWLHSGALMESAKNELTHPLHPWIRLRDVDDRDRFDRQRDQLLNRLRKRLEESNRSNTIETFAEFDEESFKQWTSTGLAFGNHPSRGGEMSIGSAERPIDHLAIPDTAHSGLISGRLQGELSSPTFRVHRRNIYYRIARFGGKGNPGRQNKNGQLHLIVDGFQFIKNPLYGYMTINVANDGQFRWIRQDVSRLQGKNVYIEIQDEDDGYIVVDRVVFSDAGPPQAVPNPHIVEMLENPAVDSPEALAVAFRDLFTEIVAQWKKGDPNALTADRTELLNLLLESHRVDRNRSIAAALKDLQEIEGKLPEPRRAVAMLDGTGENEQLLVRGNHKKPSRFVPRRFLEVLASSESIESDGSGRMKLARRVSDQNNPLTARVIVNRLWLHHFGRGIVASPDNFGRLGEPPTHPELLDWLAGELIRRDWSLKAMHRLMVTSATYRMSSHITDAAAEERDPDNLLWHRASLRRLEGEIIRDAILAISGRRDSKMFGPSVPPHLTPFMEGRGRPSRSGPLDGDGRSSIYIEVRRNFLTPMFLAFDFPTPFTTMGRRSVSNVPAQALTMMNNPFVVQQARLWAERTLERPGMTTEDRVRLLYESAFARQPTDEELVAAEHFLIEQKSEYGGNDLAAWADLCHILFNTKEFVFVE